MTQPPPPELLAARREQARAVHQKIEAVLDQLEREGKRPTVSGVARAAGCSRNTVRRHFSDRIPSPTQREQTETRLAAVDDDDTEVNLVRALSQRLREQARAHAEEVARLEAELANARGEIVRLRSHIDHELH